MTSIDISQPDVTLLLDREGIILDVTVASALLENDTETWVGRPWRETVSGTGGDAVERMIAEAQASGVSVFRQLLQRFPSGRELPFEYTTLVLGGRAGLMAIGKNLHAVAELESRLVAAQQVMERDYWKLREVETRYRLLFEASTEAVMLLRESNLRIAEANPAAIAALGHSPGLTGVVGREFLPDLAPGDRSAFLALLAGVRENGKAPGILVHLGSERKPWLLRASLTMSESGPVFLLQLNPSGPPIIEETKSDSAIAEGLIDRAPDAIVVIDRDGAVCRANQAFVELVEVANKAAVLGEPIVQWLAHPGADWSVLLESVRRHRRVPKFSTVIQSDLGSEREVEISAVGDSNEMPSYLGLIIRDIGRRLPNESYDAPARSIAEAASGGAGRRPLKDLVEEAIAIVERDYICKALNASGGNRKAAAEKLGLSRQGLYAKLNRYGLSMHGRKESEVND